MNEFADPTRHIIVMLIVPQYSTIPGCIIPVLHFSGLAFLAPDTCVDILFLYRENVQHNGFTDVSMYATVQCLNVSRSCR